MRPPLGRAPWEEADWNIQILFFMIALKILLRNLSG